MSEKYENVLKELNKRMGEGTYRGELTKAMNMLAEDHKVVFLGQSVVYPGNAIFGTLENIPPERRIELPVMEEAQMGISIGLALEGYIPVSIFPRMDFLILAVNQLVNHLDKIEEMSCGQFKPKVIIRTAVGATDPLYPGVQHCQDHTDALRLMLTNVDVVKLTEGRDIVPAYKRALESSKPTMLVELANLYLEHVVDG